MTHENGTTNGTANGKIIDVEKLAVSPNQPTQIAALLGQLNTDGKEYIDTDPQARLKTLETARSLVYALETPRESTSYAALETGVDIGLFNALGTDDKPKSVAELAESTGVDPILLGRLMKHLAAMGSIIETGRDEYSPKGFSKTLTVEKYSDAFPLVPTNTAFQMGYKSDMGFFGHVQQEPLTAKQFNNHMGVYAQGRPRWIDPGFYPVQEQLIDGAVIGEKDVLLVDVGGSFGHDLSDLRRKWPELPGRLVLQDLPEVVVSVQEIHASVDVMG